MFPIIIISRLYHLRIGREHTTDRLDNSEQRRQRMIKPGEPLLAGTGSCLSAWRLQDCTGSTTSIKLPVHSTSSESFSGRAEPYMFV